jgi:hypothetical protein
MVCLGLHMESYRITPEEGGVCLDENKLEGLR